MVEGAVMLPVFVLIFIGVIYLSRVYHTNLNAAEKVRECAWAYSLKGCDSLPPHCQRSPTTPKVDVSLSGLGNKVKDSFGELQSKGIPSDVGDLKEALGPISDLLASSLALENEQKLIAVEGYKRPAFFGGGQHNTSRNYTIMCNETPRESLEVLKSIWTSAL